LRLSKGNVEAAASRARYDFFADQLQRNETLLLGHHSQDQLETVFMRLIQGRSLLPMRLHGHLGKGTFLRPLLALQREHLLNYLSAQKITWIDDPSNCDQTLTRNFLRHRILPLLLQRWPSLAEAVDRVTEWQQGQNGLLHELLKEQGNEVSVAELPQSAASRRAWLRIFLELRGHFEVTDRALDEFCRQSQQGAAAQLDLAPGAALMGWRDTIYYEADMSVYAPTEESKPARIELGETCQFSGRHWTVKISDPQTSGGFYSPGPLRMSTRRKGLSMLWRGRQVDTKMLLRELGVPPWRRESLPLLVWQDEIVAVSTLAVSERFSDQPKGTATKGSYYRLVVAH
jgi:tRNA(Ile)-lysidine synthase